MLAENGPKSEMNELLGKILFCYLIGNIVISLQFEKAFFSLNDFMFG